MVPFKQCTFMVTYGDWVEMLKGTWPWLWSGNLIKRSDYDSLWLCYLFSFYVFFFHKNGGIVSFQCICAWYEINKNFCLARVCLKLGSQYPLIYSKQIPQGCYFLQYPILFRINNVVYQLINAINETWAQAVATKVTSMGNNEKSNIYWTSFDSETAEHQQRFYPLK